METVLVLGVIALVIVIVLIKGFKAGPSSASRVVDDSSREKRATSHREGASVAFSEIEPDPNLPVANTIRTKIRGVSFNNPDGTSRELIIQTCCHEGDALGLVRDKANKHDRNAIAVARIVYTGDGDHVRFGEQLGYLSRELAEQLAPALDSGQVCFARILNLTGDREIDVDGDDGYSAGVNIEIVEYERVAAGQGETE